MPDPTPHNRAPSLQPCAPSLQPCAPSLQPARVSCVAQGFFGPRTPVDNLFAGRDASRAYAKSSLEKATPLDFSQEKCTSAKLWHALARAISPSLCDDKISY